MVMEASPSPQSVGREFVRQYYTLLNKAPAHLHRFYNNYSSFVHGGLEQPNRETLPVVGQKQIHNRIQQLNFRDCHAKISQVDAQATLGNGVVVQVTGELSNGGAPMRRFTQTFVLAAQSPKKYYVHNDIFRYQDIVFSDEEGEGEAEGEGSGRSEGEEEEPAATAAGAAAYFPAAPPASAFPPAAFPAPPAHPPPPAQEPMSAQPLAQPPLPHLNGHPPPADDSARHLVAALQASVMSGEVETELPAAAAAASPPPGSPAAPLDAEPEPEPEPERERDTTPHSHPHPHPPPSMPNTPAAAAAVPCEPKTYANLVKSGAARGSPPAPAPGPGAPPAPAAPAPALAAAPAAAPADSRPRVARAPHPAPADGGSRRYSDAQQLFLGNLPHCATEEELRALFARFGPVAELRVHSKPAAPGAPRHPNYGFITYESPQAAHDCLNAAPLYFPADGADGVKLNVEEKKTRGREPPRRRPPSSHRAAFQPRTAYRR